MRAGSEQVATSSPLPNADVKTQPPSTQPARASAGSMNVWRSIRKSIEPFETIAVVQLARPPRFDPSGKPLTVDSCTAYASDRGTVSAQES